jgi:nitrite reductase/ring-hydroxylating ferredoxin subunit
VHMPDAGVAATCPSSGVTDVGAPATFLSNKPVYFSSGNFFVVRDSGGLYALTARCTHEGATTVVDTGVFYCPRHGAQFDFNGGVISGPVFVGLVHYAMCTLSNGHVGVVTSHTVSNSQRLVA